MSNAYDPHLRQALADKRLNATAVAAINRWLDEDEFVEFRPELTAMIERQDWDDLLDQFYRVVSFGTGGVRGVMAIGPNRMNAHTIRWASQAYAQFLNVHEANIAGRGVAIAYDSRHNSRRFMEETARVLAANNIPVHVFADCRATPELSFTVRHLGLAGGIVITASHNPPQFNGWKVYDAHGVQVMPADALLIEEQFKTVTTIKTVTYDEAVADGRIQGIDPGVDSDFLAAAKDISVSSERDVRIVYSPLHGVGTQNVLPALQAAGFTDIHTVEAQMSLDGSFPTVPDHFPQPEFPVVYDLAIAEAKHIGADIVLVSDPDADRLGMAVPDADGQWHVLSGNQGGVVMGAFYLQQLAHGNRLPRNGVIMKTTVTTELLRDVGEYHGVKVVGDLLVGFKFIGDRLEHLDPAAKFLFGAEESIGYLFGTAYRDKGAETPAIIAAELAAWCKSQDMTVPDFLESLYRQHGYYGERLYYKVIEGVGAIDQMTQAMVKLRQDLPRDIAGRPVVKTLDRLTGTVHDGQTGEVLEQRDWDRGDMLSFFFDQDERTAIHVRPSGTEPKMKYYTMVKGDVAVTGKDEIGKQAESLEAAIVRHFDDILATVSIDIFA